MLSSAVATSCARIENYKHLWGFDTLLLAGWLTGWPAI